MLISIDVRVGYSGRVGMAYPIVSAKRSIRLLDWVVTAWVVLWLILAVTIGIQIANLRSLSETVVVSSRALGDVGRALSTFSDAPFIGENVSEIARSVEETAASAQTSGNESKSTLGTLSILLGIAVFFIPTLPIVGLYLPLRVSATRETKAVRRALRNHPDDPLLIEFLARRAVEKLPYHILREISENPWEELEKGNYDRLATAELARLGIRESEKGRSRLKS